MYLYCANNPINNVDPTGKSVLIGVVLGITALIFSGATASQVAINATQTNNAQNMLLAGITGCSPSSSTLDSLANKVKNSSTLKNKVTEEIAKVNDNKINYIGTIDFDRYNGDMDLYLSIQHADIKMDGIKNGEGHWDIDVTIWDSYNFDELRDDFSFGSVANNFGLILQSIGVLKPYEWSINFKYKY